MEQTLNDLERSRQITPQLVEIRRRIHRSPELGLDTAETAALVTQKLRELGYTPHPLGSNGVTATVGKIGGRVFLLRADMDALPIQEESGLEFASQNPGVAHCCGHDLHTAMLLGAALGGGRKSRERRPGRSRSPLPTAKTPV